MTLEGKINHEAYIINGMRYKKLPKLNQRKIIYGTHVTPEGLTCTNCALTKAAERHTMEMCMNPRKAALKIGEYLEGAWPKIWEKQIKDYLFINDAPYHKKDPQIKKLSKSIPVLQ